MLFLGMSNYLVDAYLINAASVLAAGTVVRSILGVSELPCLPTASAYISLPALHI